MTSTARRARARRTRTARGCARPTASSLRWRARCAASIRKSSSSRRRAENSATRSLTRYSRPHDVRVSMTWPSSSSTERSTRTDSSIPGRCTFTMTGEPSGSCARYTWPIDAAATGCQSNAAEDVRRPAPRAPPRAAPRCRRAAPGARGPASRPSSAAAWGEIRSVRVDSTCPSFTNIPPHSSSARRSRRTGGRPPRGVDVVLAAEAERRAEPVAHRDAGDLGVPLHPPPAPAQRADRMRDRLQAGLRPHDDARDGPGTRSTPRRPSRRAT